ncbi:MAG: YesL family protein [Eubacteriales bacterium]|nr:YesL family protein [Eubacteriales bacterium]
MQGLFSPDSKFMRAMSRIGDLLLLNVLYLLTCVPVFTIGAANTALYTVCFRFGTDREEGVIRSYFRAFRDNFKQGTVLWLIVLLCGATACLNTYVFYVMPGAIRYAFVVCAILFLLVLLIAGYIFPLLSQFNNDNKSTLRNALILSIGYLPRSVLVTALNVFPFALMLLDFYSFLQAGFFWVALYFAAAAYGNTFLLRKVFAPYLKGEENKEEIL